MMQNKFLKLFGVPIGFFLIGVLFLIIGANGEQNAINFSRPGNASSWSTSDNLINAFIYIPTIIGVSFLILFISTFTISFYKWQNNR